MRYLTLFAGLAIATVPVAASAQTTTIDFDSLGFDGPTNDGARGVSSPLVLNGFVFTATDPFGLPPINTFSRQSTNSADPGGAVIFPNRSNTGITITRSGGGLFTFEGLDLTFAFDDQNSAFSGGLATFSFDGGTSTQTRAFDNLAGFQTFDFGVAGLTSVNISGNNSFQIDNVRVTPAALVAAVPEPGTWAMMLLGFGGIGYSLRRSRKTAALAKMA